MPLDIVGTAGGLALRYAGAHDVAELGARYQVIDDAYYYLEIANNLRRPRPPSWRSRCSPTPAAPPSPVPAVLALTTG